MAQNSDSPLLAFPITDPEQETRRRWLQMMSNCDETLENRDTVVDERERSSN